MTIRSGHLRRLTITVTAALLLTGTAGCSSQPPEADGTSAPATSGETPSGPEPTVREPDGIEVAAGSDAAMVLARVPEVIVLFSGRIAYPVLDLRTWGACPFVIDRADRVDAATLRVIGHEARTGCGDRVRRHVTSERLTAADRVGGQHVERVVVVSRRPSYRVDADLIPAIA